MFAAGASIHSPPWEGQSDDEALGEGGRGKRGVRLPCFALAAIRIICDAEDQSHAAHPTVHDRLDDGRQPDVVPDDSALVGKLHPPAIVASNHVTGPDRTAPDVRLVLSVQMALVGRRWRMHEEDWLVFALEDREQLISSWRGSMESLVVLTQHFLSEFDVFLPRSLVQRSHETRIGHRLCCAMYDVIRGIPAAGRKVDLTGRIRLVHFLAIYIDGAVWRSGAWHDDVPLADVLVEVAVVGHGAPDPYDQNVLELVETCWNKQIN